MFIEDLYWMAQFDQKGFNDFVLDNNVIGFFKEPIKLVSGRMTNWYVNWRNVAEDVFLLDKLTDFVTSFTKEKGLEPDCFYGVPEGATKLGVLTQYKWAKNSSNFSSGSHILPMGRAKPKDHGEIKDKFFVGMPKGKTIVLEDVTTTGGSLLATIDKLKEAGIQIIATISLTNRMELRDDGQSVKQAVEAKGIKYYSLSDAIQLLPEACKKSKPEENTIRAVEGEFERHGVEKLKLNSKVVVQLTQKEQEARKRICLALDVPTVKEALNLVSELSPYVGIFKVHSLYNVAIKEGVDIVEEISKRNGSVFLDLKFHDTPNTVYNYSKAACAPGVCMFNVHVAGGEEMCKKAIEGVNEGAQANGIERPKVIGVTVLTSLDDKDLEVQNLGMKFDDLVRKRTELAKEWGLDGVVCPASKAGELEKEFGSDFIYVTPGIKWAGLQREGQKQLCTPDLAVKDCSSSILVIGGAITKAEDKRKAAYEILQAVARNL